MDISSFKNDFIRAQRELSTGTSIKKPSEPELQENGKADAFVLTSGNNEKPEKSVKEWTILAYLNGNDKKIEGDVLNAFLFIEQSSSPENYTIVAELGRAPQQIVHPGYSPDSYDRIDGDWSGVRRYFVRQDKNNNGWGKTTWTSMGKHDGKIDSMLISDLGKADMSKPETLEEFLKWGIKNYPAKHYAVIVAGHGNGFLGTLPDFQSKNKDLSLPEFSEVFKRTEKETGIKPDLLIMDACLMAQAEAVYQLKDTAKIMVASENVNYNCLAYQDFLDGLNLRIKNNESINPEMMAMDIVSACAKHDRDIPTISAINLKNADTLKEKVADLALALLKTNTEPSLIRENIEKAHQFVDESRETKPLSDYRDLASIAENLSLDSRIKDQDIREKAAKLLKNIEQEIVITEKHEKGLFGKNDDIHGITIYAPVDGFPKDGDYGRIISNWTPKEIKPAYLSLDFVKETGWDKVIEKFQGSSKPLPPSMGGYW